MNKSPSRLTSEVKGQSIVRGANSSNNKSSLSPAPQSPPTGGNEQSSRPNLTSMSRMTHKAMPAPKKGKGKKQSLAERLGPQTTPSVVPLESAVTGKGIKLTTRARSPPPKLLSTQTSNQQSS